MNRRTGFETFPWIAPWQPISLRGRIAYEHELRLEMTPGHPLYDADFTAVGRTCDDDDILFVLHDHPAKLAVVHLTFIGRQEVAPQWPSVTLYRDVDHWVSRRMMPDVAHFETNGRSEAA